MEPQQHRWIGNCDIFEDGLPIPCTESLSSTSAMTAGPLPTTLTFLSSLPSIPAGQKVRFLGCVTHYALSSGNLSLQHAYPSTQACNNIALVDVNLLLEGLKREDMQVGTWVNVVGYVEGRVKGRGENGAVGEGGGREVVKVRVKAVMLWSAGGVEIGKYERALEGRLRATKGEIG